jgi:hypothetical protein
MKRRWLIAKVGIKHPHHAKYFVTSNRIEEAMPFVEHWARGKLFPLGR